MAKRKRADSTAAERQRRSRDRKRDARKALKEQADSELPPDLVTEPVTPPVTVQEIVHELGKLYAEARAGIRGRLDAGDANRLANVLAIALRGHDAFLIEGRIADLEKRLPAAAAGGPPLRIVR
jgi:hypothetical protein